MPSPMSRQNSASWYSSISFSITALASASPNFGPASSVRCTGPSLSRNFSSESFALVFPMFVITPRSVSSIAFRAASGDAWETSVAAAGSPPPLLTMA